MKYNKDMCSCSPASTRRFSSEVQALDLVHKHEYPHQVIAHRKIKCIMDNIMQLKRSHWK